MKETKEYMLKMVRRRDYRWDGQEVVLPGVGTLNQRPKRKVSQPHKRWGDGLPGKGTVSSINMKSLLSHVFH